MQTATLDRLTGRLCDQVNERTIAPGYASKLLMALGSKSPPTLPAAQAPVEPLTERELQVLGLIAAGLSNQEISRELVVAVGTVKSRINQLYGKLEVKNRSEAVARARKLDLS